METHGHLILVGFMGTGKSTVGRLLAQRMHRPFLDVDDVIISLDGRPIPRIFSEDGEDRFRELERRALVQSLSGADSVIACGGGAVLRPDNRHLLQAHGRVFCLTASLDTILTRIGQDPNRPLLAGANPRSRVAALLEERQNAYQAFPDQIATDLQSPAQIVDLIIKSLARE